MEENQSINPEPKKSINPIFIAGGAVALLLIIGIFFLTRSGSSSDMSADQSSSDTVNTDTTTNSTLGSETDAISTGSSSVSTEGVNVINLEAGSFYYKPNVIKVKKGEKVRIVMKSVDMMHNFNIDELGVTIPVTRAGSTATVEFTPEKVGTFEYYCSVGNHRKMGQVGKITVD